MEPLTTALYLAGIAHFGILIASATAPKALNWQEHLEKLPLLLRQMFWVYGIFIVIMIVTFGTITLVFAEELAKGGPLETAVCIMVAVFWGVRLLVQFFIFDAKPWLTSTLYRVGYHGLTAVFIFSNHNLYLGSSMKKRIILAGGTGFLGMTLAKRLEEKGYHPVILSRNPDGIKNAVRWDGKNVDDVWLKELDGADAIINLTGKNVNCRPTRANREEILKSRIDSVAVLGEAVRLVPNFPNLWIQAGSLAIYGNAGDRICDEAAHVADGYPANVCVEWESELGKAIRPEMRWVNLRIGFVLGTQGGALPFLAKLTRCGLGGSIGSGEQYISWIHLEDMLRIFIEAIENPAMEGTYNATGHGPLTNREMMATLRDVLNRPWSPPAPAFAVRIGAPILNSDPEIALTGRRCVPAKLEAEGFEFHYTDFKTALTNLYN